MSLKIQSMFSLRPCLHSVPAACVPWSTQMWTAWGEEREWRRMDIRMFFKQVSIRHSMVVTISEFRPPANSRKSYVIHEPSAPCLTNKNLACTLRGAARDFGPHKKKSNWAPVYAGDILLCCFHIKLCILMIFWLSFPYLWKEPCSPVCRSNLSPQLLDSQVVALDLAGKNTYMRLYLI